MRERRETERRWQSLHGDLSYWSLAIGESRDLLSDKAPSLGTQNAIFHRFVDRATFLASTGPWKLIIIVEFIYPIEILCSGRASALLCFSLSQSPYSFALSDFPTKSGCIRS
jgi:hypothetical protein